MDTVHVTLIRTDIDATLLVRMRDALASAEQARAARFRQADDMRRYVVARTVLKELLARRLGGEARDVRLVTGAHGKPMLAHDGRGARHGHDAREARAEGRAPHEPTSMRAPFSPSAFLADAGHAAIAPLHFNLSHSGDLALIALSPVPVGIDLERDTPADAQALAQAWFTPAEQARLERGDEDFLTCWTRREAVLKAAGTGLSGKPDFDRYACTRLNLEAAVPAMPRASCLGYRAAVAVLGAALRVQLIGSDALDFAPRATLDGHAPVSDDALCLPH